MVHNSHGLPKQPMPHRLIWSLLIVCLQVEIGKAGSNADATVPHPNRLQGYASVILLNGSCITGGKTKGRTAAGFRIFPSQLMGTRSEVVCKHRVGNVRPLVEVYIEAKPDTCFAFIVLGGASA